MASAAEQAEIASVAQTLLGGMFIEISLAAMLYGITTAQAYLYWWNFPNDVKIIRRTVLLIWLLETLHTAFCLHMMYHYVITGFGNLVTASLIIWSAGATVFTEVTIAAFAQGFFIRRIWILSHKSIIVTAIPSVLLFIRVCMSYATGVLTWTTATWKEFDQNKGSFFTVTCGLSFAAATDLAVAVILIYYLQSSRTGFQGTDHLIRSMQSYVVNSGALTMVVSISIVLTFIFVKNSLVFAGLVQVQGKLYANSFLATLNARTLRQGGGKSTSQDPNANSVELTSRRQIQTEPKVPRPIEIFQHVTSDVNDGKGPTSFTHVVDDDYSSTGMKSQSLV
ncbi:hypothetical protein BKA93DRAFT_549242 [Sparassis latifolia]|uniref:DUF6534 domain-containing protein n=1 Tax=Sparassis crispa TaxID=139825 RepID=A0A401GW59_9APHY|nr:hypothetical protein SCP_0903020 [Sparassis crispa]GBE86423.1 hypothetical protein SCP_0903020 [Sparassis crispa]